ncbi:hypothetical protein [Rhodococcus sp. Chr-9]|uniref:hypothetical protein n=1 Tax=Rhodococcus sp. Chr-9 TaxID=713612 RepID=UPI00057541D3|nr:hypothetical protein [Rhodococcus sp. Chr-9]KHJ74667.1 hypothetical protein QR64_00335 [Rhodococcus sp. Chr-9]
MSDAQTPEGRAKLRELLAKGTPGPWQADDCEGELRVGAGDAVTAWQERTDEEGRSYRVGTPPWTWKSTNLIYEHDLETWDEGEDQDDDQRRIDAELIVAARNALPALLDALDDAECEIERQRGDLVIERRRAEAAEATLDRVEELATDLENSPQVGYDSSEQWELDTRRVVARELRAALDGTS